MRSVFSSLPPVTAVAAVLTGCTSLATLNPVVSPVASSWHATVPHGGRRRSAPVVSLASTQGTK
jgi:hypothetical protein